MGGAPTMLFDALFLQENIKDKLRGISIDVSVEIQDTKRKRRQSSDPQVAPVLDTNTVNKTRSTVSTKES